MENPDKIKFKDSKELLEIANEFCEKIDHEFNLTVIEKIVVASMIYYQISAWSDIGYIKYKQEKETEKHLGAG